MFLISWRGYWQELIETLVWAHERTPIADLELHVHTTTLILVKGALDARGSKLMPDNLKKILVTVFHVMVQVVEVLVIFQLGMLFI